MFRGQSLGFQLWTGVALCVFFLSPLGKFRRPPASNHRTQMTNEETHTHTGVDINALKAAKCWDLESLNLFLYWFILLYCTMWEQCWSHHVVNLWPPQDAHGGTMPAYFRFLTILAFHVFLQEKVYQQLVSISRNVSLGGHYNMIHTYKGFRFNWTGSRTVSILLCTSCS